MTKELTTEEIVTRLLLSKEILSSKPKNFYTTTMSNLGDYLKSLPKENIIEKKETHRSKNKNLEKYAFISGRWKV